MMEQMDAKLIEVSSRTLNSHYFGPILGENEERQRKRKFRGYTPEAFNHKK